MKHFASIACLSIALALMAGCQTGSTNQPPEDNRVTVNFDRPEDFTDFRDGLPGTDRGREDYEYLIREAARDEASRYLKDGQKLTITFTDIDLAGDYLPSLATGYDIRVVKQLYPPSMDLHFTLTDASGTVVKQGERKLRDLMFMDRVSALDRQEALYHDKALLRDWIRAEFR